MTKHNKMPLRWPSYGKDEEVAVTEIIRSNQMFSDQQVRDFEVKYSEFIGSNYSLGVGNATQGLHLALAALNIGLGDEVIVPSYSWISTASCVLMQNAIPIFCEIENKTFGLDSNYLKNKITERTKAIIIVHAFGYPAKDTIKILELCKQYGIYLIEDNSHAHGSTIGNLKTGNIGDISVGSLHQRKALSVGDGGIVSTNSTTLRDKIYRLRSFGDSELSYNYRMTEFAGALGKIQLNKLVQQNEARKIRAEYICKSLEHINNIRVLLGEKNTSSVYYAVLIILEGEEIPDITSIEYCNESRNAPIRFTWEPLHKHSHFTKSAINQCARGLPWEISPYPEHKDFKLPDLPVSEYYLPRRIIEFYVHPTMDEEIFQDLVNQLKTLLESIS